MSVFYPQARAILQLVLDGFEGEGSESEPFTVPVLPREATIHRNSYKEPDQWELVFDAGDFPVDPQLVRAGEAEIYLFQTDGLKQPGQADRQFADSDGRVAVDRNLFTGGTTPKIVGLFDQQSIEMSGSGKWVTISGQDYTAVLATRHWQQVSGAPRRIPVGDRLDTFVAKMLKEADPSERLAVKVESIDTLPVVGFSEPPQIKKRGIPIETETSYWDVIYKTVTRHGFICFVRGLDLVITRPRNLSDVKSSSVKRLAWGHNIESLELSRNLGKQKVPRIIVVSYDPGARKNISVEYPEFGQESPVGTLGTKTKNKGGGKTKTGKTRKLTTTDEYQIVALYGIRDPLLLKAAAANLFNLLGRTERRIVAKTMDLCDMDGADMLDMAAGDAVNLEWFDFDRAIIGAENVTTEQKYQHLISKGYNSQVARIIAEHYAQFLNIKRPLRVRTASFAWGVDAGLSTEMELVDFVVVDGLRGVNQ